MTGQIPDDVRINVATAAQLSEVASILDAAALRTDHDAIESAIDRGDVLVAIASDGSPTNDDRSGPILGALVLDGPEITTVAVRPGRRGQGIGTGLVAAASRRRDRLVAEFEERVLPFWEALGCDIKAISAGNRYRGRL